MVVIEGVVNNRNHGGNNKHNDSKVVQFIAKGGNGVRMGLEGVKSGRET